MVKVENYPKIPKNPRYLPKKPENFRKIHKNPKYLPPSDAKLGGWGRPALPDRGVYQKKISGRYFGYTPLAQICLLTFKFGINCKTIISQTNKLNAINTKMFGEVVLHFVSEDNIRVFEDSFDVYPLEQLNRSEASTHVLNIGAEGQSRQWFVVRVELGFDEYIDRICEIQLTDGVDLPKTTEAQTQNQCKDQNHFRVGHHS